MRELMNIEGDRNDTAEARDTNLILFRLALERGADPNRQGRPNGETMLHTCGKMPAEIGRPIAELFLEHGADPNLAADDGTTPYSVAVREGNVPVADLLLAHGAKTGPASPEDQFIGACRRADSEKAWSILCSDPDIVSRIGAERGQLLDTAVIQNRFEAVKLMARLGFDLAAFGGRGASALHLAAWHGHPEVVRLLIEFHAPINARDTIYGTSPLAWAAHGSASSKSWRQGDEDYCAVVESLIDAGANYAAACNRWGVGPEQGASERVASVLKSRGFR
jgi:ankyrin repeat protein